MVLPAAAFTESYGTYVNAAGQWQSSRGIVEPPGDARPAWKIFRVLADQLELAEFEYNTPEQVTKELQGHCGDIELNNLVESKQASDYQSLDYGQQLLRVGDTPIHRVDALVRRSVPLQKSVDGQQAFVSMCQSEMDRQRVSEGDDVAVTQAGQKVTLPVKLDDGVPENCVWIPAGLMETSTLGPLCSPVELQAS